MTARIGVVKFIQYRSLEMEMLQLYQSKTAAIGKLLGAIVLSAICVGVLVNVEEASLFTGLILIVALILGVLSVRDLISSVPVLIVDAEGIREGDAVIPWNSIALMQVTQGGIPIRLKVHFRLTSGGDRVVDLQELNVFPKEALRRLMQQIEYYRPDLLSSS